MKQYVAKTAYELIDKLEKVKAIERSLEHTKEGLKMLSIKNVEDLLWKDYPEEARRIKEEAYTKAYEFIVSERKAIESDIDDL